MRKFTTLIAIALFLELSFGCNSNREPKQEFEYLPLSQYKFKEVSIDPGTAVKILGFSGGAQNNTGELYYYQFLVLNESTGDTVRILSSTISINESDEPGGKMLTTPWQFNGKKGVLDAVYEAKDELQDLNAKLQSMGADSKLDSLVKINMLTDTGNIKKFVVINKSIPEFNNSPYKTAIGILSFKKLPW